MTIYSRQKPLSELNYGWRVAMRSLIWLFDFTTSA
jgi:hypothetical protein